MDDLIKVINKLQEVLNVAEDGISLPQIVVVGSQSSGKSSVLESVVGRDFLPRGSGIVTRCPLVLQLSYVPESVKSSNKATEWGEFSHLPGQVFTDFSKIRDEIQRKTDVLAGLNKAVAHEPIFLHVYSPSVLNLTLVDLPGITKVPVGDQPLDIEAQIREMVLKFIKPANAVILAVTPANIDIANSDALQMARLVDPDGERTLGVLTKLDLMDQGTDASGVLLGKDVPLKLGYIAVVNRSQKDILSEKSVQKAREDEMTFFANHPKYKHMLDKCGTDHLSKTLNVVLTEHIKQKLPELKQRISQLLADAQKQSAAYGEELNSNTKRFVLMNVISKFSTGFSNVIDGTDVVGGLELRGGARIKYVFAVSYGNYLKNINPLESVTANDIRTALRNASGPKSPLFVPESAFELLVKRQVNKLESPCLDCVDEVCTEVLKILDTVDVKELGQYPQLKEQIMTVAHNLLDGYIGPTKEIISNLLKIETSYINTNHPDFVGSDNARKSLLARVEGVQEPPPQPVEPQPSLQVSLSSPKKTTTVAPVVTKPKVKEEVKPQPKPQPMKMETKVPKVLKPSPQISEKEKYEIELIQQLLVSYFKIIVKDIQSSVPKAIMHFLVNKMKKALNQALVLELHKEEMYESMFAESKELKTKRAKIKKDIETLTRASLILQEVRDSLCI